MQTAPFKYAWRRRFHWIKSPGYIYQCQHLCIEIKMELLYQNSFILLYYVSVACIDEYIYSLPQSIKEQALPIIYFASYSK